MSHHPIKCMLIASASITEAVFYIFCVMCGHSNCRGLIQGQILSVGINAPFHEATILQMCFWFPGLPCVRKTLDKYKSSKVAIFIPLGRLKVNPNSSPIPSILPHTVEYLVLYTCSINDTLTPAHPVMLECWMFLSSHDDMKSLDRFVRCLSNRERLLFSILDIHSGKGNDNDSSL